MAYTDYQVVTAQGASGITTAVSDLIADGWQPLGGVYQVANTSSYAQAMVKGIADSGSSSESYTLPAATTEALGGIMASASVAVSSAGVATVPAASSTASGIVKQAAYVANAGSSTATDVTTAVTDLNTLATKFNALLSALQTAGVQASS